MGALDVTLALRQGYQEVTVTSTLLHLSLPSHAHLRDLFTTLVYTLPQGTPSPSLPNVDSTTEHTATATSRALDLGE